MNSNIAGYNEINYKLIPEGAEIISERNSKENRRKNLLIVTVEKENFFTGSSEIWEVNDVSFEDLECSEEVQEVPISLLVSNLVKLGINFAGFQVFYKDENSKFFYSGVAPNFQRPYVPIISQSKIHIKIRQFIGLNNQQEAQTKSSQVQSEQAPKTESILQLLQVFSQSCSQQFENKEYAQDIIANYLDRQSLQKFQKRSLKMLKVGEIVQIISDWKKNRMVHLQENEVVNKFGLSQKAIYKLNSKLRKAALQGFNLIKHNTDSLQVLNFYLKANKKLLKMVQASNQNSLEIQKKAQKCRKYCKNKDCCKSAYLQSQPVQF